MTETIINPTQLENYFKEESEFLNCLQPFLNSLGWYGSERTVIESLPHFSNSLDITKFVKVMESLGYKLTSKFQCHNDIRDELFPCLLVKGRTASVVLEKKENGYLLYNGKTRKKEVVENICGQVYFFQKDSEKSKKKFLKQSFFKYKKYIYQIFIGSLFINLFSMLMPFFLMMIYDKVLISESKSTLFHLSAGVVMVIFFSMMFQAYQNRLMSFISAKVNAVIRNAIFKKIIELDTIKIESVSLGAQYSKLKEFEVVKDFLSGTVIQALINLPFIVILFFALFYLVGHLLWITVVGILLIVLMDIFIKPYVNARVESALLLVSDRQRFIVEAVNNLESIKLCGADEIWLKRYRQLSGNVARENFKAMLLTSTMTYMTEAIITSIVVITICLGVGLVMAQSLSIGGLIAVMMLIWRIMSPIKTIEANFPKLVQVYKALKKIHLLIQIDGETALEKNRIFSTAIKGNIEFKNLVFRYQTMSDPILVGVNLTINAGELVMIGGANGVGKSSIFYLLQKLYNPQGGAISIDGRNIQQMNSRELRQEIGYVPQKSHFFYGTILQNLLLADPMATNSEIESVLHQCYLAKDIADLPQGINTRFSDDIEQKFSSSFLQRFALARALIKKPRILLLDDPMQYLDRVTEEKILSILNSLHGKITILMITHRPSHFKLADRTLFIKNRFVTVKTQNQIGDK